MGPNDSLLNFCCFYLAQASLYKVNRCCFAVISYFIYLFSLHIFDNLPINCCYMSNRLYFCIGFIDIFLSNCQKYVKIQQAQFLLFNHSQRRLYFCICICFINIFLSICQKYVKIQKAQSLLFNHSQQSTSTTNSPNYYVCTNNYHTGECY